MFCVKVAIPHKIPHPNVENTYSLYTVENLIALPFQSSYAFLKRPHDHIGICKCCKYRAFTGTLIMYGMIIGLFAVISMHLGIQWHVLVPRQTCTQSCHGANFVIAGRTAGCRDDNLPCHQLRQNWNYDNSRFSGLWHNDSKWTAHITLTDKPFNLALMIHVMFWL